MQHRRPRKAGCLRGRTCAPSMQLNIARLSEELRYNLPNLGRLPGLCHTCGAPASSGAHRPACRYCPARATMPNPTRVKADQDGSRASQVQLKSYRDSLGQPGPSRAIVRSARTSVGNRPERRKDGLYSGSMVKASPRSASLDQESAKVIQPGPRPGRASRASP